MAESNRENYFNLSVSEQAGLLQSLALQNQHAIASSSTC